LDSLECPCQNCIVFPACRQKMTLYCEHLYKFLCHTKKDSLAGIDSYIFGGYKIGNGNAVTSLYKKYIHSTSSNAQYRIVFTYDLELRSPGLYRDSYQKEKILKKC